MKKLFQTLLLSLVAGSAFAQQQAITPTPGMVTKIDQNFDELYARGEGFYAKDYGALCNDSADDTSEIQAALAAAEAAGEGSVILPTGTCRIGPLIMKANGVHLRGQGAYATTLRFTPTGNEGTPGNNVVDPGTAIEVGKSGGVSTILYHSSISNLRITTSNTSFTKNAIRLVETGEFELRWVLIDNFYGGDSVGLRTMGHEALTVDAARIEASIPIRISRAITAYSGVAYSGDHFHFSNLYLRAPHGSDSATWYPATLKNAIVLIDDAVFLSNTGFDGYQAWIGGQYGVYWVNPGNSNSIIYNLYFKNIRLEQTHAGDATGRWGFYIDFTSAANLPRNILFENNYITGTSTTNGYYLRRVQAVTMTNEHIPANSAAGDLPVVMNVGDVYQIDWQNVYTDAASRITINSNVGDLENATFRENYHLPFSGRWAFGSSKVTRTDSTKITDWDFTNLQSSKLINWNGTVSTFCASITAPTTNYEKELSIRNISTSLFGLEHQNTTGTAANRIITPDSLPVLLMPGDVVTLKYDRSVSRWRVMNWPMRGEAMGLTLFEDFLTVPGRLTANVSGGTATSTTAGVDSTSRYVGSMALTTGTGTTGRATVGTLTTAAIVPALGPALSVIRAKIATATDGTDTFSFPSGFVDAAAGTWTDGAGYEYRWNGSAHEWSRTRVAAGSATRSVSGLAAGTSAQWLLVYINPTWSRIDYIYSTDGMSFVLDGSETTGIPSGTQYPGFGASIIKSAGTTDRSVAVDFMGYRFDQSR